MLLEEMETVGKEYVDQNGNQVKPTGKFTENALRREHGYGRRVKY